MSRAGRIVRAVTVGYGYQATVAVTGLIVTPLLLSRLGVEDFGRWLVIGQILALLGLLDLGVTAILPREVARAVGTADGSIAEVVRRAAWLVCLQTPVVGLVAAGVWAGVTAGRPELAGPLGLILAVFVVQFPLRLPAAVLTGLQDLVFVGVVQAAAWAVTTAVSVSLVLAGWGLSALAVGWAAGQLAGSAVSWWRLCTRVGRPRGFGRWPGRAALTGYLGPSAWTSVRQLAGVLLNGTELLVLGWVAGPAAVVAYACTVKLIALVNNQPYLIATAAVPAVAELQAGADRARIWRACRALGLGVMILSGGFAIAALAVTPAFVPAWVGADVYAGPTVTALAVAVMVGRHAVYTMLQTAFAFGHDRPLAVAAVADGVVTVLATAVWAALLGPVGVPLGSLTGLLLTNGPVAIRFLAVAEGVSPLRALSWLGPWLGRFAVVAGPVVAVSFSAAAGRPAVAAALVLGAGAAYVVVALPLAARDPLRSYRDRAWAAVARRLGRAPAA